MSAPELAAVGDVFAVRDVFVDSTLVRSTGIEKTSAATCLILEFTPCPISTAPVLMLTLPSVYTCTRALAWFRKVVVNEIPKQTGMMAIPFL